MSCCTLLFVSCSRQMGLGLWLAQRAARPPRRCRCHREAPAPFVSPGPRAPRGPHLTEELGGVTAQHSALVSEALHLSRQAPRGAGTVLGADRSRPAWFSAGRNRGSFPFSPPRLPCPGLILRTGKPAGTSVVLPSMLLLAQRSVSRDLLLGGSRCRQTSVQSDRTDFPAGLVPLPPAVSRRTRGQPRALCVWSSLVGALPPLRAGRVEILARECVSRHIAIARVARESCQHAAGVLFRRALLNQVHGNKVMHVFSYGFPITH